MTLKRHIRKWLEENGHEVVNCGVDSSDSVDYPDQAADVARRVATDPGSIGMIFCGSGVGVSIAANKIVGIRAAQIWDPWIAEFAKRHNDVNVLTFSNERQDHDGIRELIEIFLKAEFEGERHARRVEKIKALDGGR